MLFFYGASCTVLSRGYSLLRLPKILIAIFAQLFAFLSLFLLIKFLPYILEPPYHPLFLAIVMGAFAGVFSRFLRLPNWWLGWQFFLPILIYLAMKLTISPWYYLAAFILLWLVFSNSFGNRVPLYLTNNKTREALGTLIKTEKNVKFLDIGSGLGGNVSFMAQQDNVVISVGVETAPLPYLLSKINIGLSGAGGTILAKDLWKMPLQEFSLVYAFLSPEPMPKLWQKIIAEMDEKAIFVSNSFPVSEIEPSEVWQLADQRETHLFIYRLQDFKS
jgi:hypothetical protein